MTVLEQRCVSVQIGNGVALKRWQAICDGLQTHETVATALSRYVDADVVTSQIILSESLRS